MIWLAVFVFCVLVALGAGVMAGRSDFRSLTIPNLVHGVIVAAFFAAFFADHMAGANLLSPMKSHFAAAGIVLAISFVLFSIRMLGGGDSKLLTAYGLWAGMKGLVPLLFYMGISGAGFGLAALIIRGRKPFKNPHKGGWIDHLQAGESRVPYGIPIVIGAFAAFFLQGYLGLHGLKQFLGGGS